MKNLIAFILCFTSTIVMSQVSSVDLLMQYNCDTDQYDVSVVILEGSASTVPHRAQFNSQISIVVPTGETVVITEFNMPIQHNEIYTGTLPLEWRVHTPVIAPQVQPENDFYGITPKLAPASFYNNLESGDVVRLFSFTAGTSGQYDENVRFFQNGIDPPSNAAGMGGGDFRNGFTIGGPTGIYNNNSAISCSVDIDEEVVLNANVFPNPFQQEIIIDLPVNAEKIFIIGNDGKIFSQLINIQKGELYINTQDFPSGVYYVKIESENGAHRTKIIKI